MINNFSYGIRPNILKMSATVIYESLTYIFNLSLCTGNFPSNLKLARVTPLYKSGDIADKFFSGRIQVGIFDDAFSH
jgi:hypothetical protein